MPVFAVFAALVLLVPVVVSAATNTTIYLDVRGEYEKDGVLIALLLTLSVAGFGLLIGESDSARRLGVVVCTGVMVVSVVLVPVRSIVPVEKVVVNGSNATQVFYVYEGNGAVIGYFAPAALSALALLYYIIETGIISAVRAGREVYYEEV